MKETEYTIFVNIFLSVNSVFFLHRIIPVNNYLWSIKFIFGKKIEASYLFIRMINSELLLKEISLVGT